MRRRCNKSLTFFLALLFAVSAWMPSSGRAEVSMRCAGASPQSPPCAHAELPAAGLTEQQAAATLMACCRSMQGGSAMAPGCPMGSHSHPVLHSAALYSDALHPGAITARYCLVSIHPSPVPASLAAPRTRWLLTASPALAPPATVTGDFLPVQTPQPAFWTHSPVLSPPSAPRLHGLRAPPVV